MDFLQHLETDLTVLAAESGAKFSEVTEAANRGVIKVRKMREQYAAAIRLSGGEPPPLSMFRSQDLLRPFLLACNHSNAPAKLVSMALGSLQHLIQSDALYPGDCPNVMRVLAIQASTALKNRNWNAQVKVVQTLVMVINWNSCDMAEETLGQALNICLNLHRSKTNHVLGAVHMTIRQLVRLMFDRLVEEQQQQNNNDSQEGGSSTTSGKKPADAGQITDYHSTNHPQQHESAIIRSARQLFLDLCALSGGEGGVWLKKDLLRREVGLELLEDIFNQKPGLFLPGGIFSTFLATTVMPMLKALITTDETISLHLEARALVLLGTIIKNFGTMADLRENLRDILAAPPRYSQRSSSSKGDGERVFLWSVALSVEPIEHLVESPQVFEDFFRIFDLAAASENDDYSNQYSLRPVVEGLLQDLMPCLSLSLPYAIDKGNGSSSADLSLVSEWRAGEPLSKALFHAFEAAPTEKEIVPPLPNGEPALTALHCAASVAHTVAVLCIESQEGVTFSWVEWMNHSPLPQIVALPSKHHEEEVQVGESSTLHRRKLCDMAWPHLLACSSAAIFHSVVQPEMQKLTIQCIGCIVLACGSQRIEKGLESTFLELYRFAISYQAGAAPPFLRSRQWEMMAFFFSLVHMLSNVMNHSLWVKTFEALEYLNSACSTILPMSALSSSNANWNIGSKEDFDIRFFAQQAKGALERFPSFTSSLSSASLASALSALCSQCTNTLALDATDGGLLAAIGGTASLSSTSLAATTSFSLVSSVQAAVRSARSSLSLTRGYSENFEVSPTHHAHKASQEIGPDSFIIKMTIDCFSENAWRIGNIWDTVVACLRVMVNSSRESLREFAVVSLQELIANALIHQKGKGVTSRSPSTISHQVKTVGSGGLDALEARMPPTLSAAVPPPPIRKVSSSEQPLEDHFSRVFDAVPIENETPPSSASSSSSPSNHHVGPPLGSSSLEESLFATFGHFSTAPHMTTREAILKIQDTILQSRGQELTNAWSVVIETLKGVAVAAYFPEPTLRKEEQGDEEEVHRHPPALLFPWGGNCLLIAFNSLKLIIGDFLDWVPNHNVCKIISAIGAFGQQSEDINLSLTAVGMLWTVCDYFSGMHSSWDAMFNELQSLSTDRRPEVRNCAIHTLFSNLPGSSLAFGGEQWRSYFSNVAFHIIDQVMTYRHAASPSADTAVVPELKKGVRMLMHHSRDTDRKQWDESAVLALHGIGRVMQSFCRILAPQYTWFQTEVWPKSLNCYTKCTELEDLSPEVARAVLDGITILVRVTSHVGFAGVSTEQIEPGMTVIGGTLQHQPPKEESVVDVVADADVNNLSRSGVVVTAQNSELDAFTSNSFASTRRKMWQAAWKAFHQVAVCLIKVDRDMSQALVRCLVCMYNSSRGNTDWEFGGTPEGEQNAEELLDMLDELMMPTTIMSRPNSSDNSQVEQPVIATPSRELQGGGSSPHHRMTSAQRSILEFMRVDVDSAWEQVLYRLSLYSFSALQEGKLSQVCASESASILAELMSNGRVPGQHICNALPSLLKEIHMPSQSMIQWNRTSLKGNTNRSSSGGAQYSVLEPPPASIAHTAHAHHLVLILEGALPHLVEVGSGQEREAWHWITSSVEDMGLAWVRGCLKGPTTITITPSDDRQKPSPDNNGTEFSNSIQRAMILIVRQLELGPLCQLSRSNHSVKSHHAVDMVSLVVQSVLATVGNILCTMFGMPPSGEPERDVPTVFTSSAVIKEATRILLRAAEGIGNWGSEACTVCRRMALWELIRALYWSLHWHSVVENSLEHQQPLTMLNINLDTIPTTTATCAVESEHDPSLKSEELKAIESSIDSSCLIVLNGMTEVIQGCTFPPFFVTPALAEAVENIFTNPSNRPTREEMVAIFTAPPSAVRRKKTTELKQKQSCRNDNNNIQDILLPLYPQVLERIESRSSMIRVASSRLLSAFDIPQVLKQLKDENAMLLKEMERLCK